MSKQIEPDAPTPTPASVTTEQFAAALGDFQQAWHAADKAGREGQRSREGLLAALAALGIEVHP